MPQAFFKFRNFKIKNSPLGGKGMTLVELMTASAILVLLMGMLSVAAARVFSTNRYVLEQGYNTTELRNGLKNFSRNMREARQSDAGGYLIESADDFDLVFFANIDSDSKIERVHYFLENWQLKMGTAEASGFPQSYPVGDSEVKVVANGIVNTGSQPLFYYYNQGYPIDDENNPLATPASPENIGLVKIDIYANIDPAHAPNSMRMETFVRPRNIR